MIVLNAGGKGKRVWERQQEDAAVHVQGARNVPPPTFFIWDRGQRHEAIEQAPTNISGLVKDGVQALRAGMAVWIDQLRPNTLAGSSVSPSGSPNSTDRSPPVCISNSESTRSHAPENMVYGRYQRRIGMVASSPGVLGHQWLDPPGKSRGTGDLVSG
jgi:hypothetical protein